MGAEKRTRGGRGPEGRSERASILRSLRFSDLFSLAEEYEDSSTKPPKSRRKAALSSPRSRKNAAQPPNAEEESGSSSASVRPPIRAQEGKEQQGAGGLGASLCPGQCPLTPQSLPGGRRHKTETHQEETERVLCSGF